MSELAPIVLFTYSRPEYTRRTIECLARNSLAADSELFIFQDGLKSNAVESDRRMFQSVKNYIYEINGFKKVTITERAENFGLAKNIVDGVTRIINSYGKVIVLEDDILTSPGFLEYMNRALKIYSNNEKVMHISAYMFPVKTQLPDTFFYNSTSCWGWGTWKRAWRHYNDDAEYLIKKIIDKKLGKRFSIDGSNDFLETLQKNANGKISTWAIKWHASTFLNEGCSLHPYPSLTNNIGFEGVGENSVATNDYNWLELPKKVPVEKIDVISENLRARRAMIKFYRRHQTSIKSQIANSIKALISQSVINFLKDQIKPNEVKYSKLKKLKEVENCNSSIVDFSGKQLKILDSKSFAFMYEEIFLNEIYRFKSQNENPFIIDAGANIGLGILYFKKLFPKSKVLAFEPDPNTYKILQRNVQTFEFNNIELVNKALSDKEDELNFNGDEPNGKRFSEISASKELVKIKTVKLSDYINDKIDFLKIKITGADIKPLISCNEKLYLVKYLYVELHSSLDEESVLSDILSIITKSGFKYYIVNPDVRKAQPFNYTRNLPGMKMQLNIFGFRNQVF